LDADSSDNDNPNSVELPDSDDLESSILPVEFLIDQDIDIDSVALLDMISEKDIASQPTTSINAGEPIPSSQPRPTLTVDEAFAMWE